LFPAIRRKTVDLLNGYIRVDKITGQIDEYVVPAQLGDNAGVLGGIALAVQAAAQRH
jgi:fructokinase